MDITLDRHTPADGLLTITLLEKDYQPSVEKKLKEYTRKATIKGFRKGKVPHGMIQKMYGASILTEEVNNLVSRSVSQYIAENKLNIIGEPIPNKQQVDAIEWGVQKEFKFEFQIGLINEFKLDLSTKIKLQSYSIEVSDSTVEQTVINLQKQFGETTHPKVSKLNDILQGELIAEINIEEKRVAYLDTGRLKQEAQNKFIGKKKGEEVTFDIDTIFESPNDKATLLNLGSEATEQKGIYRLSIDTISRVEAATLNQELFDKVLGPGKVQSQEEFISHVKENISKQYQQETYRLLSQNIQRYFIEHTKIDMPDMFLKTWLMYNSNKDMNEEEMSTTLGAHKNILKWDLISNKIAHDFAVQVQPEDVKKRAKELIGQQYGGIYADAQNNKGVNELVEQYLSDQGGANFTRVKNQLQNERVLATIKDAITITENSVSMDDFKKKIKESTY